MPRVVVPLASWSEKARYPIFGRNSLSNHQAHRNFETILAGLISDSSCSSASRAACQSRRRYSVISIPVFAAVARNAINARRRERRAGALFSASVSMSALHQHPSIHPLASLPVAARSRAPPRVSSLFFPSNCQFSHNFLNLPPRPTTGECL